MADSKRVRLVNSLDTREKVVFDVTPEVNETRNITYTNTDLVHAPGNFKSYRNTANRVFQLTGIRLITRNFDEAKKNAETLQTIRSWALPYFGTGTESSINSGNNTLPNSKLGAPPPTLLLSAYASGSQSKNLYKIPVVVENINFTYPADVDYVVSPEPGVDPFPTLMSIDIQLSETHSPKTFRAFDLAAFKQGNLKDF